MHQSRNVTSLFLTNLLVTQTCQTLPRKQRLLDLHAGL